MSRWSEADLGQVSARLRGAIQAPAAGPRKRGKYGNSKVTFQGQTFDSKAELEEWQLLKTQELGGAIRSVVRQGEA